MALLGILSGVKAEMQMGLLSSDDGFSFLGKFCFDRTPTPENGKKLAHDGSHMTFDLRLRNLGHEDYKDLEVLLYDDEPTSWPALHRFPGFRPALTCPEKVAMAKNSNTAGGINSRFKLDLKSKGTWSMSRIKVHEHERPRFWYVVLANCKGFKDIHYEAIFMNQGGTWKREFGVNMQWLNVVSFIFVGIYILLVFRCEIQRRILERSNSYHVLSQALSCTVVAQCVAVTCTWLHLFVFTFDGWGLPIFNRMGEVHDFLSRVSFMVLLMLIATGVGTVRASVGFKETISGMIGLLIGCYIMLVVWNIEFRDRSSHLYVYESFPGMMILGIDMLCAVWYVVALFSNKTTKISETNKKFLRTIGFWYLWYFLSLPFIVLMAASLPLWVREKVVYTLGLSVNGIAHIGMLNAMDPKKSDLFHMKGPDLFADGDGKVKDSEKESLL